MSPAADAAAPGRPAATGRRLAARVALGTAAVLVLSGVAIGLAVALAARHLPSPAGVRAAAKSSEATLLDRSGRPLQRLRMDLRRRALDWTPLDAMSPALLDAVVAAEDRRFWWHPGVDPIGLGAALWENLRRRRPRGASTISMQLAAMLADDRGPPAAHDLRYKLAQMRDALALEARWTKRQILEVYLNRLAFRGELVGVAAAAQGLTGKGPGGLDRAEAAVLAALIRSPGAAPLRVSARACAVLRAMHAPGDCARAGLVAADLPRVPLPLAAIDEAPHLARRLLHAPGERLRSSLDAGIQRFAAATLGDHLAELTERHVDDGAVVVLDRRSGEVLAYVGSSGALSDAPDVDGVVAARQPGSTLKPFLYALAIDRGWLTAASVLDDSPLALTTPSGLYIPQDYDRRFRGAVSVRTALASSLNVPAVRTLTLVGLDRYLTTLRAFGLAGLDRDADHYGYGLALGGAETNLLELTNAYRALANGGRWSPVRFTPGPPLAEGGHQALGPQACFVVADILADPAARAPTFGLSSPLSTRSWAAVKTGTSKGMRDNWAVGFTDRYVVGVWVGNFSGEPMWDVSGISGAAPVWRDIVEHLHAAQASRAPAPPPGVVPQTVAFDPAIGSPREEWFLAGGPDAAPAGRRVVRITPPAAHIVAPPDAAIVAPDPDIPQAAQAILLQATGPADACLDLDGRHLLACGRLEGVVALPPPGVHRVELRDAGGTLLDMHRLTVRGLAAPGKG